MQYQEFQTRMSDTVSAAQDRITATDSYTRRVLGYSNMK